MASHLIARSAVRGWGISRTAWTGSMVDHSPNQMQLIADSGYPRLHVFQDLSPYICTFRDCEAQLVKYPSRKLWADHELKEHRVRKTWSCPVCSEELESSELWNAHLGQKH